MEMTNMWFMNILGTKWKPSKHMLTIFLSGLNTSFVAMLDKDIILWQKNAQTFLHREIIAASPSSLKEILNNRYKEIRTSSQRIKFMWDPLKREPNLFIFCYLTLAYQKHNVYKLNTLWRVWRDFLFNWLLCWLLKTHY